MILKQGHKYEHMPHDGKMIWLIYRGGRCYYKGSPYSLAATQALNAAFPQYWKAIRDYGLAHPALVPFVNEDPMLIVSLVEVGKVRWLVGDNVARIELGTMTLTAEAEIEADIMATKNGWNTPFGLNSWSNGYGIFYNQDYTIRPWWANNNYNSTIAGCTWAEDTRSHIKMKAGYFENNGTVFYNQTITKTNQTAMFYLYRCGVSSNFFKGGLGAVRLQDKSQGVDFHLAPFIRNGENGMLDILSGTFYPNANTQGSFTIAITDKE